MWIVVNNNYVFYLFVNYDVNNNMWVFYDCMFIFFEFWIQGGVIFDVNYDLLYGYGFGVEFILSCFVLYCLVCLMNINVCVYVSMEDVLIWVFYLIYNIIRVVFYFKDFNGKILIFCIFRKLCRFVMYEI